MNDSSTHTQRKTTSVVQKIAWLLFCFTTVQLVFLKSYVPVIPGVKADVFGGALCALTLAISLLVARSDSVRATFPEILVTILLLGIGGVSGILNSTTGSSFVHVLVLAATSVGGFWCARSLFTVPGRPQIFVWLCLTLLVLIVILALWGYYFHGQVIYYTDEAHGLVNLILLFWFCPLTLMSQRKPWMIILGLIVMLASYVALYLSGVIEGVEAGMLIPVAAMVPACVVLWQRPGARAVMFIGLFVLAAVGSYYISYASRETFSQKAYQAGRMEYYPFSWHIAKKHPFGGIGLRTSREPYLEDYDLWHPYHTKNEFRALVATFKVSQNMFLTIMVGLGIPFLILYCFALLVLFVRLTRAAVRPPPDAYPPPIALLIPLTAGLFYLVIMDLLWMPQIAWFFHILLGMIPDRAAAAEEPVPTRARRAVLVPATASIGIVAVGILVGTHPSLAPEQLPSFADMRDRMKSLPLVAPFFAERRVPAPPDPKLQGEAEGTLVVNMADYMGIPQHWGIVCILDNSKSMASETEPWHPSRLRVASVFVDELAQAMTRGSKIAIRDFTTVGPAKRKDAELTLRVSRVLNDWRETPLQGMEVSYEESVNLGDNNVCAAVLTSVVRDFRVVGAKVGQRTVLLTDGRGECPLKDLSDQLKSDVLGARLSVDVVALGMRSQIAEEFRKGAEETKGVFLRVDQPQEIGQALSSYREILNKPVRKPFVVTGYGKQWDLPPGHPIRLQAGVYKIAPPNFPGVDPASLRAEEIEVAPERTTTVNLSVMGGKVSVEKSLSLK
jgi:hypothetical protein